MKIKINSIFYLLWMGYTIIPNIALAQVAPRYNILFIISDDLNDHCTFLGYPQAMMPNMERLASHGMVFTNAYCQFPLCNPSRTSFLSGWRPDKTGIADNVTRPSSILGPDVPYLPRYFHQYGYRTERYGKILHGTFENDITWDYSEPPEVTVGGNKPALTADTAANYMPSGKWWVTSEADSLIQDGIEARHLIARMQQPQTQPFFYALGFHKPHEPFSPSLIYWNRLGDSSVQQLLPINSAGQITNRVGNGSDNILIPSTPADDLDDIPPTALTVRTPRTGTDWKNSIHGYYAEVAQMDAQLGLVLDEMDRQNLWANTIVVFIGDHGQHLGEHQGLWGKVTLFEESLHTPLIVCAPGKAAGVCSKLVEFVDIYPTLTELCGLDDQTGLEGSSFARLLDNPNQAWKRAIFSQLTKGRTVRTDQFRYNAWNDSTKELYDLYADPHQYTNLILDSSYYKTVLKQMKTILAEGWTKSLPPACPQQVFYHDADGDGYGTYSDTIHSCHPVTRYVYDSTDCDDGNATIHPSAPEICNGIDDNCNGLVDEIQSVFYHDADGDGYGIYFDTIHACSPGLGYISDSTDCDDEKAEIHPGAEEVCDGIDNNCNGEIDELRTFFADLDGDGYGNPSDSLQSCSIPAGYSSSNTDCNDGNSNIHPGAVEICNGIDDNCDGQIDEDKLTATISPAGTVSICNGSSVMLTANSGSGINYQWIKNGANIAGATGPTYTAGVAGNYKVKESNSFSCSNISAITTVGLKTLPAATIIPLTTLDICPLGGVVLKANSGTGLKYQWTRDGVAITKSTRIQCTTTVAGTFRVIVTGNNGCSKTSESVTVVNSCSSKSTVVKSSFSESTVLLPALSLYPNPSIGDVAIIYMSNSTGRIQLRVYDIPGQVLFNKTEQVVQGTNMFRLNLNTLWPGMYYVELRNGNQQNRAMLKIER